MEKGDSARAGIHRETLPAAGKANFIAANQSGGPNQPLVLSYLGLRKAVGIIGFALPFVLALGKILLQGPGIEGSISYYYYTDMGNWFVGSLCAIGVFLMSTKGYDWRDAVAGRLACLFAITVANFPTSRTSIENFVSYVHWTCAALLFLTLAYFCLALFTETSPDQRPTPQKLKRNLVYRICGYTILGSIACIGITTKVPAVNAAVKNLQPTFWFESLAVLAFGFAWLVKGETILKD
jgi:hypothetical protein